MSPVTEHRDPVGDLEHFRQPMADVDHTDAANLCTPGPSGGESRPRRDRARGGGLVEKEHFRFRHERFGHLEQLALRHRERAHRGIREQLEVQVEIREDPARPLLPAPIRRPSLSGDGIEVVLHGFGMNGRAVLVGHRQAELAGQRWRSLRGNGRPPICTTPRSGSTNPARDPEERRLPRAIFAHQGVNLTTRQSKLTAVSARTAPNCGKRPPVRAPVRGPSTPPRWIAVHCVPRPRRPFLAAPRLAPRAARSDRQPRAERSIAEHFTEHAVRHQGRS